MNKIMRTLKWFREMSILAEDEQRRSGHPEIDFEHLFLALVTIGGPVTDALAERAVTLTVAREAFEELHAHRLASLGVVRPSSEDSLRRIPEGTTRGGFVYSDGARKALELASNRPSQDSALFQTLVEEPSGHIREVLQRLGVNPDELVVRAGERAEKV